MSDQLDVPAPQIDPGQYAWEVYSKAVGGTSYDGKPLPTWDKLGDKQKAAWTAVAMAFIGGPPSEEETPVANI